MAQATVIADASALICLGWIDRLSILHGLFGRIVVPPAVAAEVTRRGDTLPDWVEVRHLRHSLDVRVEAAQLDAGEREVVGLGMEVSDALLILDDGAARDLAGELRLRVIGTAEPSLSK